MRNLLFTLLTALYIGSSWADVAKPDDRLNELVEDTASVADVGAAGLAVDDKDVFLRGVSHGDGRQLSDEDDDDDDDDSDEDDDPDREFIPEDLYRKRQIIVGTWENNGNACVDSSGDVAMSNVIKLNDAYGKDYDKKKRCLRQCQKTAGVTGCQYIFKKNDYDYSGCYALFGDDLDVDNKSVGNNLRYDCYLVSSTWTRRKGECVDEDGDSPETSRSNNVKQVNRSKLMDKSENKKHIKECLNHSKGDPEATACFLDATSNQGYKRYTQALSDTKYVGGNGDDNKVCLIRVDRTGGGGGVTKRSFEDGRCYGPTANTWGDPHYTSWDGEMYDCQAAGEIVLATAKDGTDPLQINAIQANGPWGNHVATTRSIAFKLGDNVPKIRLTTPEQPVDGECLIDFYVDDQEITASYDDLSYFDEEFDKVDLKVKKRRGNMFFAFPQQQARISISASYGRKGTYGCWFTTTICLTPENHGGEDNIIGALGTPNGDSEDEWIMRNGDHVPLPPRSDKFNRKFQGKKWCTEQFCVDKDDTMFTASMWEEYDKCSDQIVDYDEELEQFDNEQRSLLGKCKFCASKNTPAQVEHCLTECHNGTPYDGELGCKIDVGIDDIGGFDPIGNSAGDDDEDGDIPDIDDGGDDPVPRFEICEGPTAKSWGDPHYTSWDKEKYDCQAAGEVVLAQCKGGNDPLQINAIQARGDWGNRVTVNRMLSFKVDEDVPKIRVTAPADKVDGQCTVEFHIDDEAVSGSLDDLSSFDSISASNLIVTSEGGVLFFTFPNQAARISLTPSLGRRGRFGCWLGINICLTPEYHCQADNEVIIGGLGSPNGVKADEWINRDGTYDPLPPRRNKRERKIKGKEWCIREYCVAKSDSMFDDSTWEEYDECYGTVVDEDEENAACDAEDAALEGECKFCGELESEERQDICLNECTNGGPDDGHLVDIIEDLTDTIGDYNPIPTGNSAGDDDDDDFPDIDDVIDETPLPKFELCEGPTAKSWGDPHYTSWDKERYDCQAAGEVVLAMCNDDTDPLQINVIQAGGDWGNRVTVNRMLSFKVDEDVPKIRVTAPEEKVDGQCTVEFHVDDVQVSGSLDDVAYFNTIDPTKLIVTSEGGVLYFNFPGKAARISLTPSLGRKGRFGCWLGINLCLTPEHHCGADNIIGGLGTPNDSKVDEWINRDGTYDPLPPRRNKRERRKKGKKWCTREYCVAKEDTMYDNDTYDMYDKCYGKDIDEEEEDKALDEEEEAAEGKCKKCMDKEDEELAEICLNECTNGGPEDGDLVDIIDDITDCIGDYNPIGNGASDDDDDMPDVNDVDDVCTRTWGQMANVDCPNQPVVEYIPAKTGPRAEQNDPGDILYDFKFSGDGSTIKFKAWNSFYGADAADVYVEYSKPLAGGASDIECVQMEPECSSDSDPDTELEIEAACRMNGDETLVIVHYVFEDGGAYPFATELTECCHAPNANAPGVSVASFTFLVNCGCPSVGAA